MDVAYIISVIVIILLSMTLHEAMHGFMAYFLGDDTAKLEGRLTLNPIKHIDPFLTILLPLVLAISGAPVFGGAKPVPFNPNRVKYGEWGAALVGLAGPLTNFVIAFIAFGAMTLSGGNVADGLGKFFATAVSVNLGFFAFNMLPIPPLDGSRVIYALAPEFVRRGMEFIERQGIILIFIIVMVASAAVSQVIYQIVTAIIRLFMMIYGVNF